MQQLKKAVEVNTKLSSTEIGSSQNSSIKDLENPQILSTVGRTQKLLTCARISIPKSLPAKLPENNTERTKTSKERCAKNKVNLNKSKPTRLTKLPIVANKAESTKNEVQPGRTLEITISSETVRKYALFPLKPDARSFFPGYKLNFKLETDIGTITTSITSAKCGTHIGDPHAGNRIQGGLKPWIANHPEVTEGRKVCFECIEPYKKYRLTILPSLEAVTIE